MTHGSNTSTTRISELPSPHVENSSTSFTKRFDDKPVTVDEELLKLLQSKGFSPKEWIYLKCSSKLGWMNATVELELYFAEGDVCTSMESYSPRNELEALNSIVWLTDVSLSTCTHLHTNILQGLCLTILDLISDFGDKNGVKEVVKKNHSCDQEECLIESGESNGAMTQLKIAYIEGADQGAIARKDLKVGDVALEIPVSIIISEELLHETDMYGVLKEIDGISSETILLLWNIDKHKHKHKPHITKVYTRKYPRDANHPTVTTHPKGVNYPIVTIHPKGARIFLLQLRGSLENELEVLENLKDIFDDMMENMGEIDLDNGENCSWDEKLAMDFKDLQIRIACSVSTSCHTGMDMLKNELCKCMAEDILG
ncbi:hypothetical protein GmHk_13G037151 [Glycine max]|nr:hypothetical protein GmHk_13G037151 [Glycine max]